MHHTHVIVTSGDSVRLTQATSGEGVPRLTPPRIPGETMAIPGEFSRHARGNPTSAYRDKQEAVASRRAQLPGRAPADLRIWAYEFVLRLSVPPSALQHLQLELGMVEVRRPPHGARLLLCRPCAAG